MKKHFLMGILGAAALGIVIGCSSSSRSSEYQKVTPVPTLQPQLDWMAKQSTTSGLLKSFGSDAEAGTTSAYPYDQAMAAIAYVALGKEDSKNYDKAKAILTGLKNIQNPDGSWYFGYSVAGATPTATFTLKNAAQASWVAIAIASYTNATDDISFVDTATKGLDFALTLQDSDGGIFGSTTAKWKSAEHNLDAFAALTHTSAVIDKYKTKLSNTTRIVTYSQAANAVLAWLDTAWNTTDNRFNRGAGDPWGTLDTNSWGILALEPLGGSYNDHDYTKSMAWVEAHCLTSKPIAGGVVVHGYGFQSKPDSVWSEGTLGVYLAQKIANFTPTYSPLSEMGKMILPSGGVKYTTNPGHYDDSTDVNTITGSSLTSTAWYICAKKGVNPFNLFTVKESSGLWVGADGGAKELMADGGFEKGNDAAWNAWGSLPGTVQSSVTHSGTYALELNKPDDGGAQEIIYNGETDLVLSCWMKCSVATEEADAGCDFFDKDHKKLKHFSFSSVHSTDWTYVEAKLDVPAGTVYMWPYVYHNPGPGSIYFDDFSLISRPNLLSNGGFETGTAKGWDGWGYPAGVISTDGPHSGNYCLNVTGQDDGGASIVPLAGQSKLTVSGWAKISVSGEAAYFGYDFLDASKKKIPAGSGGHFAFSPITTTTWTYSEKTITEIPADAAYIWIWVYHNPGPGSIFFDDMAIY